MPNRRPVGRRAGAAASATVSRRRRSRSRRATTRGPLAPRGFDVGWRRVAAAVRDGLERARQLVERLRAEHAPHLVRRDRRPVADRATVAEAQQPGAEPQAQRVVEPPVALGRVGARSSSSGSSDSLAAASRLARRRASALPAARARPCSRRTRSRDHDDGEREHEQRAAGGTCESTRPNQSTMPCSRSPSQFSGLRNGRGVGDGAELAAARGCRARRRARVRVTGRPRPRTRAHRGDRHLHVERFVADAQVEVERDDRGRDERRGEHRRRSCWRCPARSTSAVGLAAVADQMLSAGRERGVRAARRAGWRVSDDAEHVPEVRLRELDRPAHRREHAPALEDHDRDRDREERLRRERCRRRTEQQADELAERRRARRRRARRRSAGRPCGPPARPARRSRRTASATMRVVTAATNAWVRTPTTSTTTVAASCARLVSNCGVALPLMRHAEAVGLRREQHDREEHLHRHDDDRGVPHELAEPRRGTAPRPRRGSRRSPEAADPVPLPRTLTGRTLGAAAPPTRVTACG